MILTVTVDYVFMQLLPAQKTVHSSLAPHPARNPAVQLCQVSPARTTACLAVSATRALCGMETNACIPHLVAALVVANTTR